MRRRIKLIVKGVCFCITAVLLFELLNVTMRVSDTITVASVKGFYKEPENSLDVVVIGASEVYADYCATKAWEDYGYTSYSFSVSGAPGSLYKSMAREALSKQKPKAVVFEINGFLNKDTYYERTYQLHNWIDYIPDAANRQKTIEEAIDKDKRDDFKNMFAVNHNNWKDFGGCVRTCRTRLKMQFCGQSYMKGYACKACESDYEGKLKKKELYFTKKSRKYLIDLLNYCKEQKIENVLFARFPHQKEIANPEVLDEIGKLVEEYGYDFQNFENVKSELGIEKDDSYYNPEHMNISGSEKFTKYFGQYLVDHYDVVGNHSEEIKNSWDECAKKTRKTIKRYAKMGEKQHYRFVTEMDIQ